MQNAKMLIHIYIQHIWRIYTTHETKGKYKLMEMRASVSRMLMCTCAELNVCLTKAVVVRVAIMRLLPLWFYGLGIV